jgi:hypothetical protein
MIEPIGNQGAVTCFYVQRPVMVSGATVDDVSAAQRKIGSVCSTHNRPLLDGLPRLRVPR